jgi:hypothetical protein
MPYSLITCATLGHSHSPAPLDVLAVSKPNLPFVHAFIFDLPLDDINSSLSRHHESAPPSRKHILVCLLIMTTIQERIRSAATQNDQLLQTISETDYAVSALQQSNTFIANLKNQIQLEEKKYAETSRRVKAEYEDHKKYRDSHMRRLAYKIGGKKDKFESEATREEKEWLDAVAAELHCKNALGGLNTQLAEATAVGAELDAVKKVHDEAENGLQALYSSIFDGPTPSMPEEDGKENETVAAEASFNMVQLRLSAERQARQTLRQADSLLKQAIGQIDRALQANTMDMWGFAKGYSEMAEYTSLNTTEQHVSQVRMLISQAQMIQPAISHIGDVNIAQMNFMSNVVFDNIFSDMNLRDRMQNSEAQLHRAEQNLHAELRAADERCERMQLEANQASMLLDQKRKELHSVRMAAFERIAHEMGQGAPPAYTE